MLVRMVDVQTLIKPMLLLDCVQCIARFMHGDDAQGIMDELTAHQPYIWFSPELRFAISCGLRRCMGQGFSSGLSQPVHPLLLV